MTAATVAPVRAADLEKTMGQLGWMFIVGMFFQLSVDGRPVLLPFFAAAAFVLLGHLGSYRALSRSRWFTATRVCAVVAAVASVASWIPGPEPGPAITVAGVASLVGPAAYAGVLHDWAGAQGWTPPAAVAAVARAWLLAAPALLGAWVAVLVLTTGPGPVPADSSYTPASLFGRPLQGWLPAVAIAMTAVASLVGLLKLHKASMLIRHSLRAQPDAELAAA